MGYLCEKCGLEIEEVIYNSTPGQFLISYLYTAGIPFKKIEELINTVLLWNGDVVKVFEKVAEESNQRRFGDHAIFKLVHV